MHNGNSENERDKKEIFTSHENSYKIPNLYERLLNNKNGIKFKELINDLNFKKKNYKRKNLNNDEDIDLENLFQQEIKGKRTKAIKYPKK